MIGFGLSLSSTPLVLQVLAERKQLHAQHGRAAFGILLFQDLAVLPVLAVLPLLGAQAGAQTAQAAWWAGLLKLFAVIGIVVGVRRPHLLRPALRVVARVQVGEVFTAAALLTVIATALLANAAGLSGSLGAFLAGVLLADSEFRHELEADLEPFKGLLLGLFFISVGMRGQSGPARPGTADAAARHGRVPRHQDRRGARAGRARADRSATRRWRLAFALPAGGEFAFVLFILAARQRLLDARPRICWCSR